MSKQSMLRERIKEATAQEILTAAESELAERGLAATAMNAIAERAGVSVGTLYNYFKDKDELLTTLFADRREKFATAMEEAVASTASFPFEVQLEKVVDATFSVFESRRNFLRIIVANEKPAEKKQSGKPAKSPINIFTDRFRPLIERGLAEGFLDPQDSDLYAAALSALIRGVMFERAQLDDRPFQEATAFVVRVFLNGTRKKV